ncbi:MAG: hypothetical protein EOO04_31205, partial [Chitinophagaceae bacterium]
LRKPDNSLFTTNITVAEYTINPVLTHKIINTGGHKVGYIVFNSFTSPDNATAKIDEAFNSFQTANITDLVVDLRYNGGGYVETSKYLTNLIVPAGKTGTTMSTEYYNDKLQKGQFPLLKKLFGEIPANFFSPETNRAVFSKQKNVNVTKVCFLVTGSTASASELTINNLLPHMNVTLFGERSYGKPVGFFAIPINKYDLYIAQFETRNSANKSNYYPGMLPGSTDFPGKMVFDDLTKDFGDPEEDMLQNALYYITNNSFLAVTANRLNNQAIQRTDGINRKLDARNFKGMIYNRKPGKFNLN